ncbi:MAG: tetratricopeptide repeat protein [Desulfovibrionaceae bacterium]|nr:tetratricopeptide repeat protein [Desulfovibrionaceae bacterium]
MPTRRVLAALCAVALAAGCAMPRTPVEQAGPPRDWVLTPGAEEVYSYLVFADASRRGDNRTAGQALERLLQLAPSPEVVVELANYHWRAGQLYKARDVLKKGRVDYPHHLGIALLLAQMYLSEKRSDDAVLTLQTYIRQNPENFDAVHELAAMLVQNKRFAEALDVLKTLPEERRNPDVRYYFAKAYSGLGLDKRAVEELKKAVADDPEFLEAWAELAFVYEKTKDYVAAEEVYSRLIEMGGAESLGETGFELWNRLVDINLKLNNPDRAMQIVRQGPEDLSFRLKAGVSFIDHGFFKEAGEILKPLAEEKPVKPEVWFYLALLAYESDRDLDAAAGYLAQVPTSSPHYERATIFLGNIREEQGRADEALAIATAGAKRFPEQREFRLLEARVYEGRGEVDKALAVLDEAAAKWPDDVEVLYHKGIVQEEAGQKAEGLATMEHIIELEPDHADALNYVGYSLADSGRDLDRALVLVQRALELKPDSGYIVDSLAWVHFKRGEKAKAWEAIGRAVDLVDDNGTIWEHYGDIARAMGKTIPARKGYRKALERGTDHDEAIRAKLKSL